MKKTVSLFIHCYPPARGGAEYLAEQIVEVFNQKFDVHIFTGRGETLDSYKTFDHYLPSESNPNIHRLELNQPLQRVFNKLLNKIIFVFGYFSPFYFGPVLKYSQKEIDIIRQSNIIFGIAMPTKSFYDAYYYAHKFGKKLILVPTYHNVNYYNHCGFFQQAFNYATKVFYLTPFEKDQLLQNYYIDQKKLAQTTFCPFTEKQIEDQQKKLPSIIKKHQNNFKNKQITLGFIGQISLRKNLTVFRNYLDKYLPYWQKQKIKLNVLLAGTKTNSSPEVEKLLKNKNLKIIYDFTDAQKSDIYKKIDIFINPSEEESLSIVNFEALFYGCQLIIKSNSAFDSLSPPPPIYAALNSLHQQIIKQVTTPSTPDITLLQKYSFDHFAKIVNSQ